MAEWWSVLLALLYPGAIVVLNLLEWLGVIKVPHCPDCGSRLSGGVCMPCSWKIQDEIDARRYAAAKGRWESMRTELRTQGRLVR